MKRKTETEVAEKKTTKKVRFEEAPAKKNLKEKQPQRVKGGKVDKPKNIKGKGGKPFKKNFKQSKDDKGTSKPPDWSKFKKDKKRIRIARREAGISSETLEVINQAKAIHEKLRRKKNTQDERLKLADELHKLLNEKNSYKQLALAHDTSRIIQWLLKFGSEKVREEASNALMENSVEMIQSKYARNTVKRILKYGSANIRNGVISTLFGSILKLASHTWSAPILDYIYTEIATKKQQQKLKQEFYGDIYKTNKDDNVTGLKDTYKDNREMKAAMLGATKANLTRVLNKNVHDCALVHDILFEYLQESNETDRNEMITTLSPLVAPLSNSKFGVQAAIMCIWHGTNKDKKIILKVLKEHLLSLAVHEHGHLLILSILASVDDTVLVNKTLLSILMKNIVDIAKTEWGRKVLLWLVAPEDKAYFHPTFVEWLHKGIAQGNSKKPADQRTAELLKEAMPALCKSLQEDTEFWLSNGSLSLTALAIIKTVKGEELQSTLDCIAKYISSPTWVVTEGTEEISGVEHPGLHLTLKKLAQHDKVNNENGEYTFGEAVSKVIDKATVKKWTSSNRGCFLLVTLIESNSNQVQDKLKKVLKSNVDKQSKQTPGAKILMKKLSQ